MGMRSKSADRLNSAFEDIVAVDVPSRDGHCKLELNLQSKCRGGRKFLLPKSGHFSTFQMVPRLSCFPP